MALATKNSAAYAEYIALSYFFRQVPARVVRNAHSHLSTNQNYALPFLKELELTEILAFMAKTKDGRDHIPAVCVKQNPSGTALNAILAINKKTHDDGNDILQNLKRSFEEVFKIFDDSEYDQPGLQRRALMSIVSMCSSRILCRLRLDRKATKSSIHHLLKEAIFGFQRIHTQKLHTKDLSLTLTLFISEANKVLHLVDQWSKHQNLDELSDLVEGIHLLQQTVPRFQGLLSSISNNEMNPSSRSSLLNIISKVSRYREAARKLYRMAKKFPLVRHMKIQPANLPQKAFEGQINLSQISSICSCLSKLGLSKDQQNVPLLCQNLKVDQNAAHTRYQDAQKALSESKIHAKIQIVAWCEMEAQEPFPRVVSSSKDSCFLCHTFIQLYGRIYTPKAHGRLYPGWRPPSLPEFGALQLKFVERLGESLRRDISLGLAQKKLPVHPFPNESNLLTLSDLLTTVDPPGLVSLKSESRMTLIVSSSTFSNSTSRSNRSLDSSQNPRSESSPKGCLGTTYLAKGESINGSLGLNKPSCLYIAESLEIYLELEDQSKSETKNKPLRYGIERLAADSFQYMKGQCPVVDLQQLDGEALDVTFKYPILR